MTVDAMCAEWRVVAQEALAEVNIRAKVSPYRKNSFRARVAIDKCFAMSIGQTLQSYLNDRGWHISIAVLPKLSEVRFIFYGKIV